MKVHLSIHPIVARRFPEILVGCLRAEGLRRLALPANEIEQLFSVARARLLAENVSLEQLTAEPRIAGWRKAVESCGLKPSTYRSSPEQLARRILKGQGISTPIPVVNVYCAVSAKYLAPLGAYDLDRLPEVRIDLRPGQPGRDRFSPLGARPEDMPITEDVVLYASGEEVLCWAFNHRDSRATCLTTETDRAIFVGEAVTSEQHAGLQGALHELSSLLDSAGVQVERPLFMDHTSQDALVEARRGA
jgi:DNA/RNA-binding domain of Phe-tRNA-synthetase-like protein